MVERVQHIREVQDTDGTMHRSTKIVDNGDDRLLSTGSQISSRIIAARVVWYIAGVLLVILAFRFVFGLLGANPANAFADFIYTVSYPFVAPFFSLFHYNLRYGVSRFEEYTLVAMAVYAIIAFAIARLLTIDQPT